MRVRDERRALFLDDILGSATRNAVAKHELIEIIRTNKDRVAQTDEALVKESEKLELCIRLRLVEEKLKMKFLQMLAQNWQSLV